MKFLSSLLMLSTTFGQSEEIEELLKSIPQEPSEEVLSFLDESNRTLKNQSEKNKTKCSTGSLDIGEPEDIRKKASTDLKELQIYMSFSVPIETWKEYSFFLERINGTFLLQGIPSNSFEELTQHVVKLRDAGVYAEIQLDPQAFEENKINAVPAIVIQLGNSIDKVVGNIKLEEALRIFAKEGSNKIAALQLLEKIKAIGSGDRLK